MTFLAARSARNIPTGPGSRGGHGHRWSDDPEWWSQYKKAWRAAHPESGISDRQKRAERRHAFQLERDRRWVDELVA